MDILGIIPARYASTRLPGKPLADIGGKPMVWWVHHQLSQVHGLCGVVVATDDKRIEDACQQWGIRTVMTSAACPTHLDRLWEAAGQLDAEFYLCVNGDEPLIEPDCIAALLPPAGTAPSAQYAANAMAPLTDPAAVIDISNGKVVCDTQGRGLYISRTPIPYPKGGGACLYNKFVGVQCFSRGALAFAGSTPRGPLELAEDCDEFRFIENGYPLTFVSTQSRSFSVDTGPDLEKVRAILDPVYD